jgi:hypothetical protein
LVAPWPADTVVGDPATVVAVVGAVVVSGDGGSVVGGVHLPDGQGGAVVDGTVVLVGTVVGGLVLGGVTGGRVLGGVTGGSSGGSKSHGFPQWNASPRS